jgi:hypothetical protein
MPTQPQPAPGILLYQTEDGRTRIQCRFEDETIWLTQAQIADLFQTTPQNITLHLKAIYAEGELTEEATCKQYLQVREGGARSLTRPAANEPQPAATKTSRSPYPSRSTIAGTGTIKPH